MNVLINIFFICCYKYYVFVIKISVVKFLFDKGYVRCIGKLFYCVVNLWSNYSDSGGCFYDEFKFFGCYFVSVYN